MLLGELAGDRNEKMAPAATVESEGVRRGVSKQYAA